ncbi:translocation protein Sec62-domain-containing protein [Mycena galopus ATCC 62051]|nr:translocation protein Sec62-domain-containing protein [Mycena galopus ATCC 62051]
MEQQAKASPDLRKIAVFLRSRKTGIQVRVGALSGKRYDYFKGESAIKALLSPAYAKQKGLQKITTEAEAVAVLAAVNAFAFFLRVQTSSTSPKILRLIPDQKFVADEHYVWIFERSESQWTMYTGAILLLAAVIFLWWSAMVQLGRLRASYLSMGILGVWGLFFAVVIVRLIFYLITLVVARPGIWIFPNLFTNVGFVRASFQSWKAAVEANGASARRPSLRQPRRTHLPATVVYDHGARITTNNLQAHLCACTTGGPSKSWTTGTLLARRATQASEVKGEDA